MDEQRFDQLTRALACRQPRRGLLKGVVAALSGAFGLGAAASSDARTRNPNGIPCDSPRDCQSGLCIDGVCCDGPCLGTCEACNLSGSEGICSPVMGQPVGSRGPCPGDGSVCSAACDGVTTSRCAGLPGSETSCEETVCADGVVSGGVCSGSGLCIQSTMFCGLYTCNSHGDACLTVCDRDADCLGAAHCDGGACVGDFPLGTSCDGADQCQSGQCVDGVCCDAACEGSCRHCGEDGFCTDDPEGDPCADGVCCHGECVTLGTERHCLACGDVCINGETCCESGCALIGTDDHCSGCGDACADGFACCDGNCTELGTGENCGACGHACAVAEVCESGLCLDICLPLAEPCETTEQCCDEQAVCAHRLDTHDTDCCIPLGESGCDDSGDIKCCGHLINGGTGILVGHCANGICGGVDAFCTTPEDCASGVCCHYSCCAEGQRCFQDACLG